MFVVDWLVSDIAWNVLYCMKFTACFLVLKYWPYATPAQYPLAAWYCATPSRICVLVSLGN